jgi:hypothetical protein
MTFGTSRFGIFRVLSDTGVVTSRLAQLVCKQDMQYAYTVTLSRVRATIVVVEKQCVWHNLSVCL